MKHGKSKHRKAPKQVLRFPDLDHTKLAVLNTLGSLESQRSYRFAIDDFITWYCSEPRIAFNKTVVLRYRIQLEAKHLAPATINLRLAAVRRLACEAADVGLLSPDLAAGIRRVKGAQPLGVGPGNWLSAEQAKELIRSPDLQTTGGKRDHAILALFAWLWTPAVRSCAPLYGALSAPGRLLSHCGYLWKGRAHSIRPRSKLG
jgi:integrase